MFFFYVIVFLSLCRNGSSFSEPLVNTQQGKVIGCKFELFNGKIINGFLGIPYALPPVLNLRFQPPQPHPNWTGTWNGTQFTRFCFQYNNLMNLVIGDEDCLYLNVFTPETTKKEKIKSNLLDVVVWFHGGSFIQGSANFMIPEYLLSNHDVIFVGVNFRLGPFGFLSTGDTVIPGNNGLKDQVLALRWVQLNIENFGGNPDSVTIAGSSAGASSVHLHTLSPLSKGLFHKAIMHSGTALQPWLFISKTVSNVTTEHARILGCPINSSVLMVECLRERPAVRIASLNQETMVWRHLGIQYGPVIEPVGKDSFISEDPITIIRKKRMSTPSLMSVTSDEGFIGLHNFIENESILLELDLNFNQIAPYMLYYVTRFQESELPKFGEKIRNHFFGGQSITGKENYKKLVEMLGDRLIRAYVQFAVKEHTKVKSGPIYFFKFHYAGQYSLTNKYANNFKSYGASHGDDILYILRPQNQFLMTRPGDIAMTRLMCSIWVSFMKYGEPHIRIEWPSVSHDLAETGLTYLKITSATNLRIDKFKDTSSFEFWNSSLNEFPSDETMTSFRNEL